ncbi:MAG: hypothetical protein A3B04_01495 [Candidatus Portnoybacteria bacterium RIFCSPLOWO2_02_FULL_39_11]|uniref:Uncharacterized protein n=1 Tax=Candidatus Portnoybacteria bacterium RIFCSPLOWO2_02_FULL_39_11 TaxID=1802001 RepID=A0A1G2FQU6_9BACT|nr:MAG: hypothetical protein A3B04_01495 [Candidatus Portnoybacteria bacterium RIFCSPLOWO2_02_FULL_39_11]
MLEQPKQYNLPSKDKKISPIKSEDRFKKFTTGNELMVDTIIAKNGKKKWWQPDFIEKPRREDIIKRIQQMTEKKKDILVDYERQKSPDEIRLINLANEVTNKIMKSFSGNDLNILADDIHIIEFNKKGALRKKTNNFNDNYINKTEQ